MSELDPRILKVLKEVAEGECKQCEKADLVTMACEVLEEHQEHHSIVIVISKLEEYKDNVFVCGECGLDIHVSYDGRYARVLQQTNKLSEVSHQILLKTTKE